MTLAQRCQAIQLLLLDVDGTLSEGGIAYHVPAGRGTEHLVEGKLFHVRDGSGLKLWYTSGKKAGIVTGRRSPLVQARAAELDIEHVFQGAGDKLAVLHRLLEQTGLTAAQTAFVGDDLADVPVLHRVGLAVAVADACPEALWAAHYVTRQPGGLGAVRETIELILRCQGLWPRSEPEA